MTKEDRTDYGWLIKNGHKPVPKMLARCRKCFKVRGKFDEFYGEECSCG